MIANRSVIARQPHDGEGLWFLDNLLVVKTSGRDGAPFSVIEATLPAGSRTPFHRHSGEDEAFYLLEGEMTFFSENAAPHRAGPGSYVHMPDGVAHGFRTETAVRVLVITGPAGFVAMTREAGIGAPRLELPPPPKEIDVARLARIGSENGIAILGPLPE
jgi:quercetin dioxygenase-like cupin family protein